MTNNIESLENILKQDIKNSDIWIKLGYAYFQNKEYYKAVEAYLEGLKLNPNIAINWHN